MKLKGGAKSGWIIIPAFLIVTGLKYGKKG